MKQFIPIQLELVVTRKEYITPHYIRIYLTGDEINKMEKTAVGVNNKILIPPPGCNRIYFPEFDYEKMQWTPQPEDIRPVVRTYTHRGINIEKNEIWIDFVAHGDEGPASAWAIKAQKGDVLGVMMKEGKSELYTKTENYLLVGDATAIPVLGAILEDLPSTAKGTCILEVYGEEDKQELFTNASIEIIWKYNKHPQIKSDLSQVVKDLLLPKKNRFAYVAAEFSTVKKIRNYLRKEQGWKQQELYAYSYWKSGVSEDKSVADRQNENKEI